MLHKISQTTPLPPSRAASTTPALDGGRGIDAQIPHPHRK